MTEFELTQIWGKERLTTVLWGRWTIAGGDDWREIRQRQVAMDDLDAGGYQRMLGELSSSVAAKRIPMHWGLAECGDGVGADVLAGLPLWDTLPLQAMPSRTHSSFGLLAHLLQPKDAAVCPVLIFPFEGRIIAVGRDGESLFFRSSRMELALLPQVPAQLDPAWLQQTRNLYRQKTGKELVGCCVPADCATFAASHASDEFTVLEALGGSRVQAGSLTQAELLLHKAVLLAAHEGRGSQENPVYQQRIQRRRSALTWQVACGLLLAALVLHGLTACRGPQFAPERAARLAWQKEHDRWQQLDRRWKAKDQVDSERVYPVRLVESIAASAPDPVRWRRLVVQREGDREAERYRVIAEGSVASEVGLEPLRLWLAGLPEIAGMAPPTQLQISPSAQGHCFRFTSIAQP